MLYCPDHQFVFLKCMKVAGSTLEHCLAPELGPRAIVVPRGKGGAPNEFMLDLPYFQVPWSNAWEIGLGIAGIVRRRDRELTRRVIRDLRTRKGPVHAGAPFTRCHPHMTAAEVVGVIGEDAFRGSTVVAVHRNPYDFVVSLYYFMTRHFHPNGGGDEQLTPWVRRNASLIRHHRTIISLDDACAVTDWIAYENLADDLGAICDKVGFNRTRVLDRLAKTRLKSHTRPKGPAGDPSRIIDPDTKAFIDFLLAEDFEQFGYPKVVPSITREDRIEASQAPG